MGCDSINPAQKRYLWRIFGTLVVYALFLILALWEFIHHHPTGVLAYALAILPAIPVVGIIVVYGLYLAEEKDELLRSISVQSILWSLGATMAVTTVWGFLEDFVHVPHVQLVLVFPIFCFFAGITTPLVILKYR